MPTLRSSLVIFTCSALLLCVPAAAGAGVAPGTVAYLAPSPNTLHINRTPIHRGACRHRPAWSSPSGAPGHCIPEEAAVVSTT